MFIPQTNANYSVFKKKKISTKIKSYFPHEISVWGDQMYKKMIHNKFKIIFLDKWKSNGPANS
jgi:hypothetical protein